MTIAYVHEFSVGADRTTENYDAITALLRLDEDPPPGLILHTAGFTGGTFRLFDVWESAEDQQRFERERMLPAVLAVAGETDRAPSTYSYPLHTVIACD